MEKPKLKTGKAGSTVKPKGQNVRTTLPPIKDPSTAATKGGKKGNIKTPSLPKKKQILKSKEAANPKASPNASTSTPVAAPDIAAVTLPVLGEVTVRYNHYAKPFQTRDGCLDPILVDDEYALTFAYPNAKLHLSTYSPSDFSYEEKGLTSCPLVSENSEGIFQKLQQGCTYWVHIEEDSVANLEYIARQEAYAAEQAAKRKEAEEESEQIGNIRVEKGESCSCIEGNPCLDRYGCKNWEKRFEIATKNGWKGFS